MQQKRCRKCKETLDITEFQMMSIGKYGVWSTCIKCIAENIKPYEIKRTPLKRSEKPVNKISKTNKNKIAKFPQKTKDEIKARDKVCIISWDPIEEYHHVFYWANANRWPNRNNADQGVGLSSNIHRIIHHPSPKETKKAKIYRARCMEYVLKLK